MDSESNSRPPNSRDLQTVEYFIGLLANQQQNHPESQNLQNAVTSADNLLKDLGLHERDYKPSIRQIHRELKKHFCFISSLTTCSPSRVAETETALSNGLPLIASSLPTGYSIQTGNAVIEGITRREVLKADLEVAVSEVKSRKFELRKVREDAEAVLQQERNQAERKADLLLPEHCETAVYMSEFFRTKISDLKASKVDKSTPVTEKDIEDLLTKFQYLKNGNKSLAASLDKISENGKLPPSIAEAQVVVAERKNYLQALTEQIAGLDETMNNSVFNS